MTYSSIEQWITAEAIPFSLESRESVDAAVDRLVAALGDRVELLGFGEALHGGEEILRLRNRLFQRLVDAHGYTAIAIESSYPRGRIVNKYVAGCGSESYEMVQETGFGHDFGRLEANRELVEWMRQYNADATHAVKLRFDGFDLPSGYGGPSSPRQVMMFAVEYLESIDRVRGEGFRQRTEALIGDDAQWENPMAWRDPAKSEGLLSATSQLRLEAEDLISELRVRSPELASQDEGDRFSEAEQSVNVARHLLNFYMALARNMEYAPSLAVRDLLMADNLEYIASRERERGKVLVFAHNKHLQRGQAKWQMGPNVVAWWPAGAHLNRTFGERYAVVGTGVGVSDENGIGRPEDATLESRLTAAAGPVRLIPTGGERGLAASAIKRVPVRSGSTKNRSYFPLTAESVTDFDWLAVVDSTGYSVGGRPLG